MMKKTQTIFAKYWRRGYSSIATRVKQGWAEQDGLDLFGAFFGGWFIHSFINIYKKREHWYRVDRLSKENDERFLYLLTKSLNESMARAEASHKRLLESRNRVDSD